MTDHVLYKDGDVDRPDMICDRNGRTAISCCRLCGAFESDLFNYKTCEEYEEFLESEIRDLLEPFGRVIATMQGKRQCLT